MCFYLKSPKQRAKTAKTNIECWKVIRTDNSPSYQWVHNRKDQYLFNTPCDKVKIVPNEDGEINKGYHSYKNPNSKVSGDMLPIDKVLYCSSGALEESDIKIAKFIIPAGTRYYENDTEHVSETIMLVE